MDTEETKVIFRKWRKKEGGDVIALFPEIASTVGKPQYCESYQHVGQHSGADPDIVNVTEPATEAEYAPLMRELEKIGYRLKVITRVPPGAYAKRKSQLERP
jgi:hypothetical protein